MSNPFQTKPSPTDLGTVEEWDFVLLFLVGGGVAYGRGAFMDDTAIVLHDCHVQGHGGVSSLTAPKMAFNMVNIIGMTPSPNPQLNSQSTAQLSPEKEV